MTEQLRPIPTEIYLKTRQGRIFIEVIAKNTQHGYYHIENHPIKNLDSLPSMRRRAAKHAKQLGVPFTDKTR